MFHSAWKRVGVSFYQAFTDLKTTVLDLKTRVLDLKTTLLRQKEEEKETRTTLPVGRFVMNAIEVDSEGRDCRSCGATQGSQTHKCNKCANLYHLR